MHACRIIWNSPSSLGGVGDIYNAIAPSLTLLIGSKEQIMPAHTPNTSSEIFCISFRKPRLSFRDKSANRFPAST